MAETITLYTHRGEAVEYPMPQGKCTFNLSDGPGVSWAAWTWNPITGCLHGCNYCYARAIATNGRFAKAFPAGFTPLFHRERLNAPFNTQVPMKHLDDPAYRRVFVCSMADMFGKWVPTDWIRQVLALEGGNPQWEYLHLTKFPDGYVDLTLPATAWAGTSVDEQNRVRIAERAMRQVTNVKVKWLSLEPLRERLEFTDLSMFDWLVIGAQTRTNQPGGSVPAFAPPLEWVLRLTDQAHEAGVRVHWKPNLRAVDGIDQVAWVDEYPDQMLTGCG
jgi:protein gp37